jgi:hypothetical protein
VFRQLACDYLISGKKQKIKKRKGCGPNHPAASYLSCDGLTLKTREKTPSSHAGEGWRMRKNGVLGVKSTSI